MTEEAGGSSRRWAPWAVTVGVVSVIGILAAVAVPGWAGRRADTRFRDAVASYELGVVHTGDDARLDDLIEQALSKSAANRDCPFPDEPDPIPVSVPVRAELVREFDRPTWAAANPATGDVVVTQRTGLVIRLDDGVTVADVTSTTRFDNDSGLLAAGFSTDGTWLYLYQSSWTRPPSGPRSTRVLAVPLDSGGVASGDAVTILQVEVPTGQHAGGGMAVGPDGTIWLGFGDGGGLGDPRANGQDPTVFLGKIVRIDPRPEAGTYAIPADNPHASSDDGIRDEIAAVGVRNPWRIWYDTADDAVWFGDVGQSCWEEIDRLPVSPAPSAANFGWDVREADVPFQTPPVEPDEYPEFIDPTFAYHHGAGWCAVTAGFVYRGAVPLGGLSTGSFLYGDFCGDGVYALVGDDRTGWRSHDLGVVVPHPVAIVPDADGQPLVVSLYADNADESGGAVYRLR